MFIFDFFKNFIQRLGLFQKKGRILFLGLANAGKTTLLGRMKDGRFKQYDPTLGSNVEELQIQNMKLKAFDLGGHEAVIKAWKNYYHNIDGIFFLVDSSNKEKFQDSKEELQKILTCEELKNVPIVFLGNKIDLILAVSEEEIRRQHGLPDKQILEKIDYEIVNNHPIKIIMCSLSRNLGYLEGFTWLSKFIK
ncbi:hypothetical protein ABPG72_013643 [Tetrahymena utriculariae]